MSRGNGGEILPRTTPNTRTGGMTAILVKISGEKAQRTQRGGGKRGGEMRVTQGAKLVCFCPGNGWVFHANIREM